LARHVWQVLCFGRKVQGRPGCIMENNVNIDVK
jgi:hypothetical protein